MANRSRLALRQDVERRDWDAVSLSCVQGRGGANVGELRAVIRDMLGRLGQSHFALLPGVCRQCSADRRAIPAVPRLRRAAGRRRSHGNGSRPDGGGAAAGVHTGWKLRSIDGAATTRAPRVAPGHARAAVDAGGSVAAGADAAARPVWFARGSDVRGRIRRHVRGPSKRRLEPGEPVTVGTCRRCSCGCGHSASRRRRDARRA